MLEELWNSNSSCFRVTALFDYRSFKKEYPEFEPPPFIEDSISFVRDASRNGPICMKTHLPWVLLPKKIQNSEKKPKVIVYFHLISITKYNK